MVFETKISSQEDPKSVFEPRSPRVKFISAFSAQTQNFVRDGCQHGPMSTSKIPENRRPGASGRLLDVLSRLQEVLWRFQGGLELLQEVLEMFRGGFKRSRSRPGGEEAPAGGWPGAGFRSLK